MTEWVVFTVSHIAQEQTFLTTNSPIKIQEKSDELHSIIGQIRWRTPDFLKNSFEWLKEINYGLLDQLPKTTREQLNTKIGFGL